MNLANVKSVACMGGLAISVAGCTPEIDSTTVMPVNVRTAFSQQADFAERYVITGEITAAQLIRPGFPISGTITDIRVNIGDPVVDGDVLAQLDATLLLADQEAAAASVQSALSQLQLASQQLERQRTLRQQGFVAQAAVDTAASARSTAQAGLTSAEAQLAQADDALENAVLLARYDGVVTRRWVEPGQLVQAGQPIVEYAREGALEARFSVPEAAFYKDFDTDAFDLQLVEDSGITASARLKEVSPAVSTEDGTVTIWTTVEKPSGMMPLGAAVNVTATTLARPAIAIPWTALDREGGQTIVWVVDSKSRQVIATPIDVEVHTTDHTIVAGGLPAGTEFVIEGVQFLKTGLPVHTVMPGEGE